MPMPSVAPRLVTRQAWLIFASLAALTALLLAGSLRLPALVAPSLPLCWPGVLVLGMDETTERYGEYGEIGLLWLVSLPWLLICSVILSRWLRRPARARAARPVSEF